MTRFCPSCDKAWPDGQVVCRDCLVELVDDPHAVVRCHHCDRDWPARMQSCPNCLAELRVDPAAAADALGDFLALGGHLFRPDGVQAFASGPECTLGRLSPRGGLVLTNGDGLVEASVKGPDIAAIAPLACQDLDGSTLFRLQRYEAAPRALVAVAADGAALGTYLRAEHERRLDVRDETSAPVGHLGPVGRTGHWALVETGGTALAAFRVFDDEQEGWLDDQWSLRQVASRLPLLPLGAVALVLAAKVLLGRPRPVASNRVHPDDQRPLWQQWE